RPSPPLHVAPSAFNTTPPPAFSPLSLHDALPISGSRSAVRAPAEASPRGWSSACTTKEECSRARSGSSRPCSMTAPQPTHRSTRSEEHTSELQSRFDLVCRLLLEKKDEQAEVRYQ